MSGQPIIQEILQKMDAVEALKKARLIRLNMKRRIVFIRPELWEGRDDAFKSSWAKNLFLYFCFKMPDKFKNSEQIKFKEFDTGQLMATYTEDKGLTLS
jgi:hypothetical protein